MLATVKKTEFTNERFDVTAHVFQVTAAELETLIQALTKADVTLSVDMPDGSRRYFGGGVEHTRHVDPNPHRLTNCDSG